MTNTECQIHSVPRMCQPLTTVEIAWQRRNRLTRILKRRWNYLLNLLARPSARGTATSAPSNTAAATKTKPLRPGDLVRVKSWDEIKVTLDKWNALKGCGFMQEMLSYCGSTQRVLKPLEKFLDERDYLIKKCKGIVILDGVLCEGTKDFGPCDRSCFYFWRKEWLEKIADKE